MHENFGAESYTYISIIFWVKGREKILKTKAKRQFLATKDKVLIDLIILVVLSIITLILPFAEYTYKKTIYTLSGYQFLTGAVIQGGKLIIDPQGIIIAALLFITLAFVVALIFPKFKKVRLTSFLMMLAGAGQVGFGIYFAMQIEDILDGCKKAGTQYGVWVFVALGLLYVVRGFYTLYKNKVLNALDFMILPGCLYFLINNYFPLAGILIAFKKVDYSVGIWKSPWVGFENFKYLFTSSDAWIMTRNTILYNLAFIILGTVMGIVVGIFLNEVFAKKLQKLYQTTILLPQLVSIVIVAYIVYAFLSNEAGLINNSILGDENTINFYSTKVFWPFILVIVNVWKGLGYNSIIYLSAIVGIDKSIYEAALVDGANRWQQIIRITVPLLKPTIITLTIMSIGRIFYSDFGLFYQIPMDSGALYPVTQTIDTYVYRSLLKLNNISMSSAASAYQSIVGFAVVLAANAIVRKVDDENAMF